VIHRADYHGVLLDEAVRLGVDVKLNSKVVDIDFSETPHVVLESGEFIEADVIVGADGRCMSVVVGQESRIDIAL
jgi:salicylate hydroxylase